jgi:hypothetical protein
MKSYLTFALCLAAVARAGVAAAEAEPLATPVPPPAALRSLQQGMAQMEQAIAHAESLLPEISQAAEGAARRWIAGGDLYAAGDDCATDELFYRAGGLIGIKRIGPKKQNGNGSQVPWGEVPEKSVILYAMHRTADPGILLFEDLAHLMFEGDTVVFFGSSRWLACRRSVEALRKRVPAERFFFIDTDLPQDTSFATADGRRYGDCAGMVTAVHAWAFTAELIAACTRQNKTPGIWPSGAIPGYAAWEKQYQKIKFHDDITVRPIEAGVLGRRYLQVLRRQIQACAASVPQVRAAARMLADVPADRAVYVMVDSHLLAGETRLPKELPNWMLVQRSWRWRRAVLTVEKGDGVLWLGAFDWPVGEAEQAAKLGNPLAATSLYGPGQKPPHAQLVMPGATTQGEPPLAAGTARIGVDPSPAAATSAATNAVVWIPAPWQYPDAVLELDGYPLPACPSSSLVQGTLLWGLIGEVLEIKCRNDDHTKKTEAVNK